MTLVDTYLRCSAASAGQAVRRSMLRHRHLDEHPLVIVGYHLSGEISAPIAILLGQSIDNAHFFYAAEPRNRQIRFSRVINPLAEYITQYFATVEVPQVLVPNRSTLEWIRYLGRALRYLPTSDAAFTVPAAVPLAGLHLSFIAQRAQRPGSSLLLAATELLSQCWTSGQSALEDENIFSQLGWISPSHGLTGAKAAELAERIQLPAGPVPDPGWDRDILAPALAAFHERRGDREILVAADALGGGIGDLAKEALMPAWEATWESIGLLLQVEAAPSVANRWDDEAQDWSRHSERASRGEARFGTRLTARGGAYLLNDREIALQSLTAEQVTEDRLLFAAAEAEGQALSGHVVAIDHSYRERPRGRKNFCSRPLLHIRLEEPCLMPLGTELWWSARPNKLRAEVHAIDRGQQVLILKISQGMRGLLPAVGTEARFSIFGLSSVPSPRLPDEVPWTHLPPDDTIS